MRIQNEQSGSSSLYAQPMALQAVPEAESPTAAATKDIATKDILEARLESALSQLSAPGPLPNTTTRQGHLALLTRWYYRPQQKRIGEICFPTVPEAGNPHWPLRSMLRSIGRIAAAHLR